MATLQSIDLAKGGEKLVKISILIIFQGIDFEVVRNHQTKQIFMKHMSLRACMPLA